MLREGINYECVRSAAAALYHVVRLLEMSKMRTVDFGEIEEAGARWAKEHDLHQTRQPGKGSIRAFSGRARSWLRFHGHFAEASDERGPFGSRLSAFRKELIDTRGLSPSTVAGYCGRV